MKTPNPTHIESSKEDYFESLKEEIKEFEREKERIRRVMGDLGGTKYSSRDLIINIAFAILTGGVLGAQFIFHLDSILSIEVALLLVSAKIILMIHAQHKHNHFMFWVLNTIEYRVNDIFKIVKKIEKEHLEKSQSSTSSNISQKK